MQNFPTVLENISDLTFEQIHSLLSLAKKFKKGDIPLGPMQSEGGKNPICATSFLENSTRTKHSFAIAIQQLGAMYIDFNAEASSLKKGESLEETLLTLHYQGVDLCIIRTSNSHELSQFKINPPLKIINGGDGINQHPTQALLDLFTMLECQHGPKNKTIAIIGDCIHSRVGHSLIELLPQFGAKIILCGPEEYLPKNYGPDILCTTSLSEAMAKSDLLYLLRIQKERHVNQNNHNHYHDNYGINLEKLKKEKKFFPLYHPGPVNIEVEISKDALKSPHYFGHEQVKNSIFMRMAIIKTMFHS